MMIRILLVDDHPSVCEGTKNMIEQDPEMDVTVSYSSPEALEMAKSGEYDLMLFDLNIPVLSGLELTKRLISINPEFRILIYTGYEISSNFNILVEAGVSGIVSKTASREQLLTAIRCALRGESVIPVSLLRQLRRSDMRVSASRDEQQMEDISINEREQEILQEVADGRSNKDIASKLLMSQRTVEYNLTRVFEKLGVHSRSEATVKAKQLGLIGDRNFL